MRTVKTAGVALAVIGAATLALSTAAGPEHATEHNKALVLRMLEDSVTGRNVDALDDAMSADYTHHGADGIKSDREALKAAVRAFGNGFPDAKFEMLDQIAEADKVVTRWRFTGTHKGPLEGLPPTGRPVDLTGISIHRIEGDRVVEGWEASNALIFLQQLGVFPGSDAPAYD